MAGGARSDVRLPAAGPRLAELDALVPCEGRREGQGGAALPAGRRRQAGERAGRRTHGRRDPVPDRARRGVRGRGPGRYRAAPPDRPGAPVPNWDRAARDPGIDDGLLLDPDAPVTPTQAVEQLALRTLHYTGERFPEDVRADAHRSLDTHPDVLLLPATFTVVEQTAARGWSPVAGPHPTAHAARKSLDFSLTWMWPRMHGLIPEGADPRSDARTHATAPADQRAAAALAAYVEAADSLRTGRVHRLEFQGTVYQIVRTRRLLRWGPDGPEGPRPSDVNSQEPTRIHLALDEDGQVIPED